MTYASEIARMAPLSTFDPAAFVGDEATPQSVCDFILALAVAYNDLRDVTFGQLLLDASRPTTSAPTPELGVYAGLKVSLLRILFASVHELLKLVRKSTTPIEHESFEKVTRALDKASKSAWSAIVATSRGEEETSDLGKMLMFVRNKVAFHYDGKEIRRGYRARFVEGEPTDPYLSFGGAMESTRFHFADASTEAYMSLKVSDLGIEDFSMEASRLHDDLNQALYQIVTRFPATRGFAWRKVSP